MLRLPSTWYLDIWEVIGWDLYKASTLSFMQIISVYDKNSTLTWLPDFGRDKNHTDFNLRHHDLQFSNIQNIFYVKQIPFFAANPYSYIWKR